MGECRSHGSSDPDRHRRTDGSPGIAAAAYDDPRLFNDRCEECRLPIYRCESEGGQMLRLCASHLRLPN
jgi:hypothetical protein